MASAAYLAEHLAEVPAIVIPTIIGRHDGNGRPGLFDSVIQAAWSFCLALRARGLGTTWVTAALAGRGQGEGDPRHPRPHDRDRAASRWRGPRAPSSAVRRGTRRGRSPTSTGSARRPSAVPARAALRGRSRAIAEIDIDAAAGGGVVARDRREAAGPVLRRVPRRRVASDERGVGAVFIGRNHHQAVGEWALPCFVDACEEPIAFGWRTSDADNPGARWRFDLEPAAGRTRLRFSYVIGPGPSGTTMAIAEPGQGGAGPAAPPRRGAGQHAAHGGGHQAARRGVAMTLRVGIATMRSSAAGVELVRQAERLGADSVWVPEFWAGDALTPLAYLAARRRPSDWPRGSSSSAPAPRRCSPCRRCPSRRCPMAGSYSASAPAARR